MATPEGTSSTQSTHPCAALQTDYIDLYQLHGFDPATPIDETLGALDDLVHQGKVRYIGCSNFLTYQLVRAVGRSETLGLVRFDSVQPRYNLLFRQIEREMLPFCGEEGVGVIPYNPIAGGLLSGKHRRGEPPAAGGRFTLANAGPMYQGRYWHDREFDTVDQLLGLADEAGVSLVTLSVAWVLAHEAITAPIVGASHPDQLASSLEAAEFVPRRTSAIPARRNHPRVPDGRRPSIGASVAEGIKRSLRVVTHRVGITDTESGLGRERGHLLVGLGDEGGVLRTCI